MFMLISMLEGVPNQGIAKERRQKEFDHFYVFGTLSGTFSGASVTFSSLFCQAPLPDSFCGSVSKQRWL